MLSEYCCRGCAFTVGLPSLYESRIPPSEELVDETSHQERGQSSPPATHFNGWRCSCRVLESTTSTFARPCPLMLRQVSHARHARETAPSQPWLAHSTAQKTGTAKALLLVYVALARNIEFVMEMLLFTGVLGTS